MAEVRTIYAVKFDNRTGRELCRKEIGVARFGLQNNPNSISWWKYQQLKRLADKAFNHYRREYEVIMDEDGRRIQYSQYGIIDGSPVRFGFDKKRNGGV